MPRCPRARRVAAARARAGARGSRPWGALLVALGLLLAQGPMLLHLLLVRHTACEHGELVELTAPPAPARAVDEESGAAAQGRLDVGDPGGSDHVHCDVLALRHRPADVAQAIGAASLLSLEPGVSLGARGESRPVPLLSLAPKSSPPAA